MREILNLTVGMLLIVPYTAYPQEKINVVVTSSWTAAYAEMAGVPHYEMLAPIGMQHPTEYEIQIEDIKKLKNADLIICGGYESMMQEIRTGLQIDEDKILQITTDYNLEHIRESVREIASRLNLSHTAEDNLVRVSGLYEDSRRRLSEAGVSGSPVIVQFFLRTFAADMDLNVKGIFGPRQLEAFDIQDLMKLDFDLILDNAHNPSAQPLAETRKEVKIAYLINFPGLKGTRTIEGVIRYNTEMILDLYEE